VVLILIYSDAFSQAPSVMNGNVKICDIPLAFAGQLASKGGATER
jgi:hypothetical protein